MKKSTIIKIAKLAIKNEINGLICAQIQNYDLWYAVELLKYDRIEEINLTKEDFKQLNKEILKQHRRIIKFLNIKG